MACKTVHLWLSGPEMAHFGAQKTYREPTNDSYEIYLRSLRIMAKTMPKTGQRPVVCPPIGKAIRALGVTCSNLFPADNSALLKEDKRKEGLIKALDSINTRQGDWSIYPAAVTLTRHI